MTMMGTRIMAAALCAAAAGAALADTPETTRRTRIFIRSQLKYGLERDDFLHSWYERPLHQDTTYATRAPNRGPFLNDLSWAAYEDRRLRSVPLHERPQRGH